MDFYPEQLPVPSALMTEHLHLEMLEPAHVELDYAAFMSSWPRLTLWSGGPWPYADFTLEENRGDLQRHMDEFLNREAFAYTVLNRDRNRCEGCIYIYPLAAMYKRLAVDDLPEPAATDAYVSYWVTDDALERDLDRELLAALIDWFDREWQFSRMLFLANRNQLRDIDEYEGAGLQRQLTIDGPRSPGRFHFYEVAD